jgi:hypothetical protein
MKKQKKDIQSERVGSNYTKSEKKMLSKVSKGKLGTYQRLATLEKLATIV